MVTRIFCNLAINTIKFSIIFFYRRLFSQRWLKISLIVTGTILMLNLVSQVLANIFQCVPVRSSWEEAIYGKCMEFSATTLTAGAVNGVTDCVLISLPIPALWKLKISVQKKRLLILTFVAGGL